MTATQLCNFLPVSKDVECAVVAGKEDIMVTLTCVAIINGIALPELDIITGSLSGAVCKEMYTLTI